MLEEGTDPETRTEMFRRINTGGRQANEAEIRRGSLPGPFNDLILELSTLPKFIEMTPLSRKLVLEREREELVTRFFVYRDGFGQSGEFDGYRDDPRKYIYKWVKNANEHFEDNRGALNEQRAYFEEMLGFVDATFPNGFRKTGTANQVPRVRYEAIAIGSSLALQRSPELLTLRVDGADIVNHPTFLEVTKSDAANNRSRLVARIDFVLQALLTR